MTEYGYIIDEDLVEYKRKIYDLFTSYFNNPVLTKIKDDDQHSVYAVRLNVQLRENRYILVTCKKDVFLPGTRFPLNDIRWNSFQTRSLNKELECGNFTYMSKKTNPYSTRIFLIDRYDKMTTYSCKDYKISLCMLHTEETKYQYPEIGTISGALETYQTIIKIET